MVFKSLGDVAALLELLRKHDVYQAKVGTLEITLFPSKPSAPSSVDLEAIKAALDEEDKGGKPSDEWLPSLKRRPT